MAIPGKMVIDSLIAGVANLTVNMTNPTPGDTDRLYIQVKLTTDTEWTTADIPDQASFQIWNLDSITAYDVRVRAVNDTDGAGEFSDISTQTTLMDSFGPPLVLWDEDGVVGGGDGQPLTRVDNTGTLGSAYDLNFLMGTTAALTEQIRNGRKCWQSGAGGASGIRETTTPPSPSIAQPCTMYVCLLPFFVDSNSKWVVRGGNGDIEVRITDFAWQITSGSQGDYNFSTAPSIDGRIYVLEIEIDGTNTIGRIVDDQSNDTGDLSVANFISTGNISPESVAWNFDETVNDDAAFQCYEISVYAGTGTAAERLARREELLQKWALNAPDLFSYRTAQANISLDDISVSASGTVSPAPPSAGGSNSVSIGIGINL